MPYINRRPPKYNIGTRIGRYLFFNFILTISPVLINLFISYTNQIPYKDTISYCPDICFMTIVTSSSSIKDVLGSKVINENKGIFGGLLIFNIVFMILSMIIYGNIAKDTLSPNIGQNITFQQFLMSLIFYISSVILGLGVQIGGGIDG